MSGDGDDVPDDGRAMLGWLTEKRTPEGKTYFRGANFGACYLHMQPGPINAEGERVWLLFAVPNTHAMVPGSATGKAPKPSIAD